VFGFTKLLIVIYNADETVFCSKKTGKNNSWKARKRNGQVYQADRGENVRVVACFSASGACMPLFVICIRARLRQAHKSDLPPECAAYMCDLGYNNQHFFLRTRYFRKIGSLGKCMLVLGGQVSQG
jgi:hypothetical protein